VGGCTVLESSGRFTLAMIKSVARAFTCSQLTAPPSCPGSAPDEDTITGGGVPRRRTNARASDAGAMVDALRRLSGAVLQSLRPQAHDYEEGTWHAIQGGVPRQHLGAISRGSAVRICAAPVPLPLVRSSVTGGSSLPESGWLDYSQVSRKTPENEGSFAYGIA
jgi:hypothetical protein